MAPIHHNCAHCHYLKRTSPEQRFLLCEFWSAEVPPIPGAFTAFGYDYVITHCHIQPEALACPFFTERRSNGATSAELAPQALPA